MTTTLSEIESLTLTVQQEIRVHAPLDITFAALSSNWGPPTKCPMERRCP